MAHYTISRDHFPLATVRAESIEEAANRYARRLNRRAIAHRTTGSAGLSGAFRPYVYDKRGGAENAIAEAFHVRETV